MSRRILRPEEREIWQKVTATARPRQPEQARPVDDPRAPSKPVQPKGRIAPPPVFRIGEHAPVARPLLAAAPAPRDQLAMQAIVMDRGAHRAMTRGRLEPEARIDLHGMTLAEAHPALTGFVLRARASGRRLVLVITGKGKQRPDHGPVPIRSGVLRHQVPHWLSLPPLSAAVLQIAAAHARHGGEGAYYVYLRRGRT